MERTSPAELPASSSCLLDFVLSILRFGKIFHGAFIIHGSTSWDNFCPLGEFDLIQRALYACLTRARQRRPRAIDSTMKQPLSSWMFALGAGIVLSPASGAEPIFVPGPASGYAAPGNAPPQATVNSAGLAAGTRQRGAGTVEDPYWRRAVNWDAETDLELGHGTYSDAFATMIADSGVTVGYGVSGAAIKPLRWEANGDLTELGALNAQTDGAIEAKVLAVNAGGLAVGYSQVFDETNNPLGTRALRWAAGTTEPLQLPLASSNGDFAAAQARVVSDSGLIAGMGDVFAEGIPVGQRGIRWSADYAAATILETISLDAGGTGFAEVTAINDAGVAAGNARKYSGATNLGLRAVRWEADSSAPVELGHLGTTPAGANVDTTAIAIDGAGNIAGLSQKYVDGVAKGTRPVVWKAGTTTPVELGIFGTDVNGAARGNMSAMNKYGFIAGTMGTFSETGATIGRRAIVWGVHGEAYNLNDLLPPDSGWILTVATDISDTGWVTGYGTYDPDGEGPLPAYDSYFSLQSDLFVVTPDIHVTVDETPLTDGVSTVDFGSAALGYTSVQKTFTVSNNGTAPLDLTGVSVEGANSADFIVDAGGLGTTLAVDASAAFTVTFSPGAEGARTASLKILSSDLDTPSFDIALSGAGVEPTAGVIAFGSAEISVNESALTVQVPVTRVGGDSGAVSVRVNSAPGAATAPADFDAVTDHLVSFDSGDSATKFVPVTLVADGLEEPEETFTLSLSDPQGGALLGAIQTVTIRIQADDSQKPAVVITTPAANQVVNSTPSGALTISGAASDNVGVDKVQVSLNGGAYADAVLSGGATSVTWSLEVTPIGGVNEVAVRALDASGNAAVAGRRFTYRKLSALTVNVIGGGKVTGVKTGAVYEVGKKYTLTAIPAANQAFDGWTGAGLSAPANEAAKLSFIFTEALFDDPVLTAAFVALPFTADKIGSFNGLVAPGSGTELSNSTQGVMNLKLTAKGAFSGKLKIDGLALSVRGLFTNAGEARFGADRASTLLVARANKPALELAGVHWDAGTNTIRGVINQYHRQTLAAQSEFVLNRAAFTARNPVSPAGYTANGGKYTVILPAKAQTNGLLPGDYPQGTGIGLITITPAGLVRLAGTLADNTAVTTSAPLSSGLRAPLHVPLYRAQGSFSVEIALDESQPDSDLKGADAVWFRPFQNKTPHYLWGWEEGVVLDLLGAKYAGGNKALPGLGSASAEGNAVLAFSEGKLSEVVSHSLNISPDNKVTRLSGETSYTLSIAAKTGDIKGSFTHPNGGKAAFKGKIFQKGETAGAHGFFLTPAAKPIDGTGESGKVLLRKKEDD